MAELNPDGTRASPGQRAYNFASNGGGAITYRVLVSTLSLIIATLIGLMWNDLSSSLKTINATLADHDRALSANAAIIAVHESRLNQADNARTLLWTAARANAEKIGDHEHRITVLEARARLR